MPYYPAASSSGGGSVVFADEGSAVGTGTVLNFVGAGVAATFSGGTAIATITGGSVSGGVALLGIASYAPGSDTTIGTATSTTLVDVDATNLAVTFTAPSSGKVVVKLYGLCGPTSVGGQAIRWGVRESTSIVGGPVLVDPAGVTVGRYLVTSIYITGISGGSHTYKFAYAQSANTVALYGGPTYGAAVIEVWEAP